MTLNPTVLAAEDNQDDAFFLQRAFGHASLHVVPDGEAVIEFLSARTLAEQPSLVLLDIKMPRRNGHEVLQWIRAHDTLSHLVVIMMTSSQEPADIAEARRLGANSYLIKPGGLDDFRAVVRALQTYWISHDQFVRTAG